MKRLTIAIIIACFIIFPVFVNAQEEDITAEEDIGADISATQTGTLSGIVIETGTAATSIKDVEVILTSPQLEGVQDKKITTDEGKYEFKDLKPGPYMIALRKRGYRDRDLLNRIVAAGQDEYKEYKMTKRDTPITFFQKMGWIAWPLLACSVVALTFIIERIVAFAKLRSRVSTEQLLEQITTALRNDDIMEAVSVCEEAGGPLANIVKAGLLKYSQAMIEEKEITKEEIMDAINEAGLLEIPELERYLPVLATVAVISPLFGLLGTVWGMIRSFTTIALEGTGDPQALAGGISQALLTTATGLAVAIPSLVFYNLFDSMVTRRVTEIQQVSNEIISTLLTGSISASSE